MPYELNDKSLYEWIQISNRLKCTKVEQKNFLGQNHGNMKPATVSQSGEEVETDFDSDSDYSESEKVLKKDKIQGKYPFLQNRPLYETHQVSITTSNKLIPNSVGGSLPTCDKGDREYYCTTIFNIV
jgi:hypothetical protein